MTRECLEIDWRYRRTPWTWQSLGRLLAAFGAVFLLGQGRLLCVDRPWLLLLGFPLGHVAFGASVAFLGLSLRKGLYTAIASVRYLYRPFGFATMAHHAIVAFFEELVSRAIPLSYLAGHWWQIALLAVGFSAFHYQKARGLRVLYHLDLILFALLLGWIYVRTGEFWLLVVIHFVRNASVAKVYVTVHNGEARSAEAVSDTTGSRP